MNDFYEQSQRQIADENMRDWLSQSAAAMRAVASALEQASEQARMVALEAEKMFYAMGGKR